MSQLQGSKSANSDLPTGVDNAEKHNFQNLLLVLIDKRGKVVWNSVNPAGPFSEATVYESVPEEEKEKVHEALSRCMLLGHTVDYDVRALSPMVPDSFVNWRVRLWPAGQVSGELAGCALCVVLPENYREITQSDLDLLRLLSQDLTLREISQKMFLSESAIDTKVKNLKIKLGCKTLHGLVSAATARFLV